MSILETERAISAAGIVSECVLLLAWLARGQKRPFWFVGFYALYHLLFSICATVFHVRIHDMGDVAYYVDYGIDFSLLCCVTVELFVNSARPLSAWPTRVRLFLIAGAFVGTLIPALLAFSLKLAGYERSRLWDARLDLLTSLLLCTVLLITAAVNLQLRVQRSNEIESVRWGMMLWVGWTLIINLLRAQHGWLVSKGFDAGSNAVWVLMVFFWAYSVWNVGDASAVSKRTDIDAVG